MSLAALVVTLPTPGQCSDHAQSPPNGSAIVQNAQPIAVTDYVPLKNAAMAFNVLSNDTDADHDTLIVVEATARHGAVAFTADGLVAYAADPAQLRADEINYVLSDGRGGRTMGKVIVTAP